MVPNLGSEKATHIYTYQMGTSNSVKQHRLRKMIAWLSDKEGIGKEFISLYIPPNSSLDQTISILNNQPNSATIDNENLRNRFQGSFKNLIQHLKLKKEIPENGLAVFAGTLAINDQKEVASIEELVPPEPVATYLYEVDDHFHLEPLREMLRNPRAVGIIAMDSKKKRASVC